MFGKKRLEERLNAARNDYLKEVRSLHDVFCEEIRAMKKDIAELKKTQEELKKAGSSSSEEEADTYAKLIDEWKNGLEDSE